MDHSNLIRNFTDENFESQIRKGITLVDFYAVWCGPCRMLAPIIDEIAKEFEGKVNVGKVDIDSEQSTAAEYQVTSVPTLILFKAGKEIGRLIGLRDVDAVRDFVNGAF